MYGSYELAKHYAEKGSGVLTAQVRIPELFIPLDIEANSLAPVLRGVLEIFGYRQGQGLRIKNLHGPIRLGPGWVLVLEPTCVGPHTDRLPTVWPCRLPRRRYIFGACGESCVGWHTLWFRWMVLWC